MKCQHCLVAASYVERSSARMEYYERVLRLSALRPELRIRAKGIVRDSAPLYRRLFRDSAPCPTPTRADRHRRVPRQCHRRHQRRRHPHPPPNRPPPRVPHSPDRRCGDRQAGCARGGGPAARRSRRRAAVWRTRSCAPGPNGNLIVFVPTEPKIYHIVHVDRLASIVSDGYLWSDAEARRSGVGGTTIGMDHIKERRLNRLVLTSHPHLHVGNCVALYFCPRSVMLYSIYIRSSELQYQGGKT